MKNIKTKTALLLSSAGSILLGYIYFRSSLAITDANVGLWGQFAFFLGLFALGSAFLTINKFTRFLISLEQLALAALQVLPALRWVELYYTIPGGRSLAGHPVWLYSLPHILLGLFAVIVFLSLLLGYRKQN